MTMKLEDSSKRTLMPKSWGLCRSRNRGTLRTPMPKKVVTK